MNEEKLERPMPLQLGERAPNVVLEAITRGGTVAIDDFRGQTPVLVGLFRGLQCPFCRRQIAAMANLAGPLREKGIDSLTVVNTPADRARLYFRYHPLPSFLAASDPDRISHRAFGLPNLEFTENEDEWPRKVSMPTVSSMRIDMPGELPEPMNLETAAPYLNKLDGYDWTEDDDKTNTLAGGQLIGEFLLDRDGIVRWAFTEAEGGGSLMFGVPKPQDVMAAASRLVS
ncbi:peroxiredoxin-like family protein [Sinorhizobium sp. BG8]|uniref:peroxiredoxin-like family protein n=1 Tax=Sinorhizobium sp. BG8 TaxID=2613773 RepID=UPI00193E756D|nr:peroxiredoxin-like family protein [Sinorhizobium sp. BG8]QRM53992.1 AhpC/TSA family protein [Sinorhizobium sp. BG8]